eukprot:6185632-Pleurochrysis_carterae.AAC.3
MRQLLTHQILQDSATSALSSLIVAFSQLFFGSVVFQSQALVRTAIANCRAARSRASRRAGSRRFARTRIAVTLTLRHAPTRWPPYPNATGTSTARLYLAL